MQHEFFFRTILIRGKMTSFSGAPKRCSTVRTVLLTISVISSAVPYQEGYRTWLLCPWNLLLRGGQKKREEEGKTGKGNGNKLISEAPSAPRGIR